FHHIFIMKFCLSCYEEYDPTWVKKCYSALRYYSFGYCESCSNIYTLDLCMAITQKKEMCRNKTFNNGCYIHRHLNQLDFNSYAHNVLEPYSIPGSCFRWSVIDFLYSHQCIKCK